MESMSPSSLPQKFKTIQTIQSGQIGKLQELLGSRLRKSTLLKESTQKVIEDPQQVEAWLDECETSLRERVEARSNIIIRHAKVDRKLTPQQMLDATDRDQYSHKDFVASTNMPAGEGEEVDVYFFKVDRDSSGAELEEEYTIRGLKPDPYAQGRINTDDPTFADEHPNVCYWQDADGNWCFLMFCWHDGVRLVRICRSDGDLSRRNWFAGVVRKS